MAESLPQIQKYILVITRAVPDFGSGSGRNPALFQIWQKSGSAENPTGAG